MLHLTFDDSIYTLSTIPLPSLAPNTPPSLVGSSAPDSPPLSNMQSTHVSPPSSHPMVIGSYTGPLRPKQIFNISATSYISPIPRSTSRAMCDPNWRAAMDSVMFALLSNHT